MTGACHLSVYHDAAILDIRGEVNAPQPDIAPALEAHRLPDTRHGAIALLSSQRVFSVGIVGAHDEMVAVIPAPVRAEIELERSIAPLVVTQPDAVQPRITRPIRRSDHQKGSPTMPILGRLQLAR